MNEIEEIKNRIDIVELVGGYAQLKQTGRNFKACCPFHSEKTPSFIVSPERQMWRCFGACGEGGDVFSFLMKVDGLTFPEAVEQLAQKAGVVINKKNFEKNDQKARLYGANSLAIDHYAEKLFSKEGEQALAYLTKNRELNAETIKSFGLGWSTAEKGSLISALKEHGYSQEDLVKSGLAATKSGEVRDLFWNRLMFPIRDISGRALGFSARVLDDALPKYLNTPETDIYHKSNVLYGIDLAKESIRKLDHAIIVEGNMDVIASHQAGIKNVVASSGTALTETQLKLVGRITKNLKLAFDVDFAGSQATRRAIELAWEQGFNLKVITISTGKDPADAVKSDPNLWKNAVKEATYVIDYLFETAFKNHDPQDSLGRKKIAKDLLPVIKRIPDDIERDSYIKKLAKALSVDEKSIVAALSKTGQAKKVEPTTYKPAREKSSSPEDRTKALEENMIGLLILLPHYFDFADNLLDRGDFTDELIGKDFEKMIKYYNKKGQITEEAFLKSLNKDDKERFSVYLLSAENAYGDLDEDKKAEEIYFGIKRLKKSSLDKKKKVLSEKIAQFELVKNNSKREEMLLEYQALLEEEKGLS